MLTSAPLLLAALACQPSVDEPLDSEVPPADDTSATPLSATGDTAVPTTDTEPTVAEFDCSTVPVRPVSTTELLGPSGYHDLAFTPDGRAIGSNRSNSDLMSAEYAGTTNVFVPNVGTVEQMVWLPDGDLAIASANDGIVRVASNGARTPINASIYAYGLILGPDELLYAADQSRVQRIDPTTGDTQVVLPVGSLPDGTPRVIAFDLTGTRMYVGTYQGSQGRIYVVELDATMTPTGPPTVFARGVGGGAYHDAIGVDICGYLYVPDYDSRALWRISPDGAIVQEYVDANGFISSDYGHGVEWGNGVGGWRDDAIYLPMPYNQNKVLEVVVGVPSQHWDGIGVWP